MLLYIIIMTQGLTFAIFAALAFGFWTVFHQQAANYLDKTFGAILVSLTAVIFGLFFLIPGIKSKHLVSNPKGIIFIALAGVCAFAIDYFALKAYGSGLKVSVGGPMIIGGSVIVATIIGFFLGDAFNLIKICGITLVAIGLVLISLYSK
jgi:bacterial/archaeal transporter family protein